MKVSIIIPVYNVEQYLEECILSVVNQKYKNIELLLIDDGSTDKSPEICDAFANSDARITVIHKKNGGLSSARNAGLDAACGDVICFLDSDDYLLHDSVLSNLIHMFKTNRADVIEFGYCKVTSDRKKISDTIFDTALYNLNEGHVLLSEGIKKGAVQACAWNKAISSKLFFNGELKFREGATSEDIDWTLRLLKKTQVYMTVPMVCIAYRMRTTSITHTMDVQKFNCLIENLIYSERMVNEPYEKDYMCIQTANMLINYAMLCPKSRKQSADAVKYFLHYLTRKVNRRSRALLLAIQITGLSFTSTLISIVLKIK